MPHSFSRLRHIPLAKFIFAIVIIIAFYSFGTFGFFNLFSSALLIKILVILYTIFGLLAFENLGLRSSDRKKILAVSLVFFLYYGLFTTLAIGSIFNGFVNALLMWIVFVYLMYVEKYYLILIAKSIVVISAISAGMAFIVYFVYLFFPYLLDPNSIHLLDSSTSNRPIKAASFFDYLSFTSGDGYEFLGTRVTRVKGFSNEPSSTIVHYLAPAILGFLMSRPYQLLSFILLAFILIASSPLIGISIIFLSFLVMLILKISSTNIQNLIFITCILLSTLLITFGDQLLIIMQVFGNDLYSYTSTDLIARKFDGQGSAYWRLWDFNRAINIIYNYPLGGGGGNTMAGLIIQIGLVGGLPLMIVIGIFAINLFKLAQLRFITDRKMSTRYSMSLLLAMLYVLFILSGYGWDRLPGLIMLMLIYRIID